MRTPATRQAARVILGKLFRVTSRTRTVPTVPVHYPKTTGRGEDVLIGTRERKIRRKEGGKIESAATIRTDAPKSTAQVDKHRIAYKGLHAPETGHFSFSSEQLEQSKAFVELSLGAITTAARLGTRALKSWLLGDTTHKASRASGTYTKAMDAMQPTQEAEAKKEVETTTSKEDTTYAPRVESYIGNIRQIYVVYKDILTTLESKGLIDKSPDMATLAQQNQVSGEYQVDEFTNCDLQELRMQSGRAGMTLLNVVVNAESNINSSLSLLMIKELFARKADESPEGREEIMKFIKVLREMLPERLEAELRAQKVSPETVGELLNGPISLEMWKAITEKTSLPLAHSQWCAFSLGLKDGTIEGYYPKLQMKACPTRGRKPSLVILSVPEELEASIKVAHGKAVANKGLGDGGVDQVFLDKIDMLLLLHISSHRVIRQTKTMFDTGRICESRRDHRTGELVVSIGEEHESKTDEVIAVPAISKVKSSEFFPHSSQTTKDFKTEISEDILSMSGMSGMSGKI